MIVKEKMIIVMISQAKSNRNVDGNGMKVVRKVAMLRVTENIALFYRL